MLGEIPIFARLAIGSEKLRLFVTNKRMIIAHVGKRGAGALAATSFFGRLSAAVEDLFKSGREYKRRKALEHGPDSILAADKDNFPISYGEVVSVLVQGTSGLTRISVLTKDDKFEFSSLWRPEKVVDLLHGPLGPKLSVGEAVERSGRVLR